jgi:tRNA uridine 5-carboxymethylaminomethyl modification enzyme
MMTSRAEHRLHLRQDNADLRLTEIGFRAGLAGEERMERTRRKREETEKLLRELRTTRFAPGEKLNAFLRDREQPETEGSLNAEELLRRPQIRMADLQTLKPEWQEVSPAAAEQTEIAVKYAGYLEKQQHMIDQARRMEETRLAEDIPYDQIEHLRLEARQKLAKQKPVSLAAAGRIPGVNPADVAVLTVWLEKQRRSGK